MRPIEALLRRHIGLDAAAIGPALIERAVRLRMKEYDLDNADTYCDLLATSRPELEQLIEAVVVTETWFFRDREPFHHFAQLALKRIKPRSTASPPPLRILSLPCASGEEPYSLAMALLDAGLPEPAFAIDALDISAHALARAAGAVYGKNSFRGGELGFRDRHFQSTQEGYALSPLVRRCVKFERGNILDYDFLAERPPYDFIFCRNLLIYLDDAAQKLALSQLYRLLAADGILFVGPAELPVVLSQGGVNVQNAEERRAERGGRNSGLRTPNAALATPAGAWQATGEPMVFACWKAEVRSPKSALRPPPSDFHPPHSELHTPHSVLELARQHAEAGRLAEAAALCHAQLAAAVPSAQAYYLLGLVTEAAGEAEVRNAERAVRNFGRRTPNSEIALPPSALAAAIKYYRKALYLEPKHHAALVRITHALEQSGDVAAARRFQRRRDNEELKMQNAK